MHLLMLDTCVWLELASKKSELPILAAIEYLVSENIVNILIPNLVKEEFERNKDRVANQTRQRLSQECKLVKGIIESFGGENKQQAIDVINDVNHRLPILSEANYMTISRVEALFKDAVEVSVTDTAKLKAAHRAIAKLAPFHSGKNSMADAVLIETFDEFRLMNVSDYESFRFVTVNHTDFSDRDHRKPHPDFSGIFDQKTTLFFITPNAALSDLADPEEVEFETGHGWEEETRGLFEILEAMDELIDKIWYNRHCNRAHGIASGRVTIIPDGTKRYGNDVIHESIWAGAQAAAKEVEEKYEDTGPWDDFEWGMLNGKLSALRWVLGDDWDNLDT
ncbi:PIN domain-containing protein [Azotobacter chroococcum]|uniref:DUF4935 domain-containing protein n=1 Tax=Azotobacter chroococcum NCIMB 8003 TaxID=1328314 RepID=A0A0C4WS36_9GAMM|nr:PIN domain-containing protein [Azotobacter chroococcum]AJE23474.1 Hypothetical protein Achr_a100 [Azotobacter chroococcum NCIMB 8003]